MARALNRSWKNPNQQPIVGNGQDARPAALLVSTAAIRDIHASWMRDWAGTTTDSLDAADADRVEVSAQTEWPSTPGLQRKTGNRSRSGRSSGMASHAAG
jgi:hypothetical protein